MTHPKKQVATEANLGPAVTFTSGCHSQSVGQKSNVNTREKCNSTIGMELGFVLMQCNGRLRRDLDQGQRYFPVQQLNAMSNISAEWPARHYNRRITGAFHVVDRTPTALDQPVFVRSSKGMRVATYAADPNKTTLRCEVIEHA